ncbi:uncharacterized protein N7477_001202 [Penicillium maclennaniae]|uniref:uncharacterized protein n=1 Tax=Penicillium maclennaniae TaxID=1343394 RepID=UPI002540BFA1|nr:uncharacterized protein N7477_001202 [Penicillium maclennaniae]KAJ5684857.1 hypothetical protein N7477_001202 [Penicillium maclennaniae]
MPCSSFPDEEMPKEVAYRMIKDDLVLDGNPMLNLASFVTTYMEDEAEKLIAESSNKNVIDHEEYPKSVEIEHRCLNILADLFHTPQKDGKATAVGTACIGSSEAIMLGVLAMKKRWQNERKAQGKDTSRPNIIMSTGVQVCWEKAARYFDIEEKLVPCTETRFVIDPVEAVNLVDENTIGIAAILGTTYTGQYEDVKSINDLLIERGLDTPIHVDAASGGFVAPFVNPDLIWDFQLRNVVSINVSGHKSTPGIGWALWRSVEYLPKELIFNINYLGADQLNFTLNFSKPASHIIAQYYQMIPDYLADQLEDQGLRPHIVFDEFALSHKLRERGWIVPAYTMAADCEKMSMMRVVVREEFSQSRCDSLVHDIQFALRVLAEQEIQNMQRYQKLMQGQLALPKTLCAETSCLPISLAPEKTGITINTRECIDT